jgi:hypothetical protein
MDTLTLTRPDDWHLHLRDGSALRAVAPHSARQFARAIVMPNLRPPVTTTEQALAYRARILDAVPAGLEFQPLMTLYLTDNTSPAEIARARSSGHIARLQALPGWRDDEFRFRGNRRPQNPSGAGSHAGARLAVVDPRRSHRPGQWTCSTAKRCSSTGS